VINRRASCSVIIGIIVRKGLILPFALEAQHACGRRSVKDSRCRAPRVPDRPPSVPNCAAYQSERKNKLATPRFRALTRSLHISFPKASRFSQSPSHRPGRSSFSPSCCWNAVNISGGASGSGPPAGGSGAEGCHLRRIRCESHGEVVPGSEAGSLYNGLVKKITLQRICHRVQDRVADLSVIAPPGAPPKPTPGMLFGSA
jgi:hypothetical protein